MRVAPSDVLAGRLARLRQALTGQSLDALIVTSLPNVAYLTGFFASAGALVISSDRVALIADSRYAEPLAARAREWPAICPAVLEPGVSFDAAVVSAVAPFAGSRVGFEARHLTVARHQYLTHELAQRGWTDELLATDGVVEELRARKDEWEVHRLRDGAARLSSVAKCILPKVLAGRTEADVAAEIDASLRRAGFERAAFDTIVASGPNAALPHARAGDRQIGEGELVVLDFGGVLDGYCTDLTRTVVVGRMGTREREVIERVAEAQQAAFLSVRAGVAPEAVDGAARERLASHGLADAFTHSTGHGLGLEIHEAPRLTRARPDHTEPPLAAGNVVTLEPGVYFPGWGGVRIEDDVLVTEEGAQWLTDVPVRCEQRMTLDEIKRLIEFLREQDVTEFELDYDGVKLRVKSGVATAAHVPVVPAVHVVSSPSPAMPAAPHPHAGNGPSAPAAAEAESSEEGTELAIVKSPIVGTFYRASEPEAKNLVDIGEMVKKGQVLCIIEAMKLMNEIDSEYDGEVVNVYVENGQAVQYGERLFAIRLK